MASFSNTENIQIKGEGFSNIKPLSLNSTIREKISEMAAKAGIAEPELFEGKHDLPYAMSYHNPETGKNRIFVSTEMLKLLDNDREIIALFSHEIGHLANKDRETMLQSATVGAALFVGTGIFVNGLPKLRENQDKPVSRRLFGKTAAAAMLGLSSAAAGGVTYAGGQYILPDKEVAADDVGLKLCGDKEAMFSMMQKLRHWYYEHGMLTNLESRVGRMY